MNPSPQESSICQDMLDELEALQIQGEPDFIVEIIDSFLKTSPPRVEAMIAHLNQKNLVALGSDAHALKSSSFALGAKILSRLCQKIESLKATQDVETANSYFKELQTEYHRAHAALTQIKNQRLHSQKSA